MGEKPEPDEDVLAGKLAHARRLLSEVDLPPAERARLHRQFIAVCDALKSSDSGQSTGLRRLTAFLSTLDRAAVKNHQDKNLKDKSTP